MGRATTPIGLAGMNKITVLANFCNKIPACSAPFGLLRRHDATSEQAIAPAPAACAACYDG
jgi:hypothetical protein